MPLHLIKLCVGCDSVADLEDWIQQKLKQKKRRGQKPEHIHTTRMVPRRADELTDGGSLYWVIRGQITCRERILAVRPFTDRDGVGRSGTSVNTNVCSGSRRFSTSVNSSPSARRSAMPWSPSWWPRG